MNNQRDILISLARDHNLTIAQAEEVYRLFCSFIQQEISSDKKEDALFLPEKFRTIHIDNFGKFIPNQRKIRHANYCLSKKLNQKL
jgi:nucleoid DNA-binding protein